jgi:beta-barrel assembly-enhancing protease
MKRNYRGTKHLIAGLSVMAIVFAPLTALTQTKISYHSNKFKPEDDVKVGRKAAQEVEQQLPILRDRQATDYVASVGQRLVAAIPPEFQHPEFRYYFKIVDASDINAFALPGGPMYVNRGMIEAAHTEGEMAGVMAHELSHVALRHGTAQATKAQKYSLLAGILGIGGTILGGPALGQLAAAPVGVYFLRFSREYETEADLLGARIMSRAGYDPHDLANMFKTIERTSGGGGGGFLSDHPAPANRYERINQEAQYLRVENPIRDTGEFERIQARLRGFPRALSTEEIMRGGQRYPGNNGGRYPDANGRDPNDSGRYPDDNSGRNPNRRGNPSDDSRYPERGPSGRVSIPSSRFRSYTELGILRVSVPDNWRELPDNNSVWFAPEGAYGQHQGQSVYTHGINIGMARTGGSDLQRATEDLINNLTQGNSNLRRSGRLLRTTLDGRDALTTTMSNTNEATGQPETINITTTQLRNGDLLYVISVVPQNQVGNYQRVFSTVLRSIRLNET